MSIVYQSWEAGAGPTVGYKVGAQGSHCVSEGANLTRHGQQDSLIRGLSALSLYVQSQSNSEASTCDNKVDGDAVSQDQHDSYQSTSHVDALALATSTTLSDRSQPGNWPQQYMYEERSFDSSCGSVPLSPLKVDIVTENGRFVRFHPVSERFLIHNQHLPALDVVSEEKPWESNPTVDESEESGSSVSDARDNSPCTSEDASHDVPGELEVQSVCNGSLDSLSSLEASLPVKKGLSRFYSGKSRSFSCLADVVSVKDIVKPENPYARKRKNVAAFNSSCLDRPRFCTLRSGSGICKKPLHSNKSTLALAVAMSTKEGSLDGDEHDCPVFVGTSSGWQSSSAPSRSYSLSDLQGAGCQCSPGRS